MAAPFSSPQESYDKILEEIRTSSLHFMVQESPYSIYLIWRKKYIKNSLNHVHINNAKSHNKEEVKKKDEDLAKQNSIIWILENNYGIFSMNS